MKKSLVITALAVFVMMSSNVVSQAKTDSSVEKINKNKQVKVEAPAKENIAKDKDKKTLTDKDKQQPPQFDGKNAPDGKQPPKDSDGKQPPQFDGKNAPDGQQPPSDANGKKLSK